jgi:hypothetical protein
MDILFFFFKFCVCLMSSDEAGYESDPQVADIAPEDISLGSGEIQSEQAARLRSVSPEPEEQGNYKRLAHELDSPALNWCMPLITHFADRRVALGKQQQPIRMLSVCVGLFSEGMIAEVPRPCSLSCRD